MVLYNWILMKTNKSKKIFQYLEILINFCNTIKKYGQRMIRSSYYHYIRELVTDGLILPITIQEGTFKF